MHKIVGIVRDLVPNISKHDILNLAAALAFYTALSLSPVLVIVLWVFRQLGFQDQQAVIREMVELVGPEAGRVLGIIIENAKEAPELGTVAGVFGFGALLLSAGGVFGQIQSSLNRIFEVAPPKTVDWKLYIRKRLISLGMVFSLGFVAIVSLGASAAVSFLSQRIAGGDGSAAAPFGILDLALSFLLFAGFFAALFKILPDAKIPWRESIFGGILTALLFSFGKRLIGLYLGKSSIGSAYGAAGSVVIFLVWIYYSSVILFIGAELTQLCNRAFWPTASRRPSELEPGQVPANS